MPGWNTDSINKLKRFIIDSTNATGMAAVQSGSILFDYGDIKETSYVASGRKRSFHFVWSFVETGKSDLANGCK